MSAASPPAITASVPSSAPMVPPETGASIHLMPLVAFSRAATERAASGWIDEKSTTSFPEPLAAARPLGPNTTFVHRSGVGQAHENDADGFGDIARLRGGPGAGVDRSGDFAVRPVPDGHVVAGFHQPPSHRRSHHPEPEIAELFDLLSVRC